MWVGVWVGWYVGECFPTCCAWWPCFCFGFCICLIFLSGTSAPHGGRHCGPITTWIALKGADGGPVVFFGTRFSPLYRPRPGIIRRTTINIVYFYNCCYSVCNHSLAIQRASAPPCDGQGEWVPQLVEHRISCTAESEPANGEQLLGCSLSAACCCDPIPTAYLKQYLHLNSKSAQRFLGSLFSYHMLALNLVTE